MDLHLSLIARFKRVIASLLLMIFGLSSPLSAARTDGWEATKIEGHEYVSVDRIKQFYNFSKLTHSGSSIVLENEKVIVKFNIGGSECLMNNVKFILSHNVEMLSGKAYVSRVDVDKLIDPVLRPNFIQNAGDFRTVILDPGHGGKDPGAQNALGNEADYNLKVAETLKSKLEALGYKVMMTRQSNIYQSLLERVEIANSVKENAIYISIHFNSGNRAAHGIETFSLSPPGVSHYGRDWKATDDQSCAGNEHDSANIALATSVHVGVLARLGQNTFDRGIKRARFSVLSGVIHPAILIEGGFMTHPYEARLIGDPRYQNAIAAGIVDAIGAYHRATSTKPTTAYQN